MTSRKQKKKNKKRQSPPNESLTRISLGSFPNTPYDPNLFPFHQEEPPSFLALYSYEMQLRQMECIASMSGIRFS